MPYGKSACFWSLGFLALAFAPSALSVEIALPELCRRVMGELDSYETLLAATGSPIEAARLRQASLTATRDVIQRFQELKNDPQFRGRSDEFLWNHAVDLVSARVGNEGYGGHPARYLDHALAALAGRTTAIQEASGRGEAQFREALAIFRDPASALKGPQTTPQEDYTIAVKALQRLQKGDPANAAHVMDLIKALEDPAVKASLESAGLSPLAIVRDILLHDLGKEFNDAELSDYRAFMKTVFPDGNFLNTQILPHEFASMILIAQLAKEAGIDAAKVPRLQALIANHNAGYNPKMAGFHFWVAGFAWPAFAQGMQRAGVDVPTTYAPVMHAWQGGKPETVVFTGFDRGVSLTLASQEKFSMALVNQGKWNPDALIGQFAANAKGVPQEMQSVLSRLVSYVGHQKAAAIQKAMNDYFVKGEAKRMTDLGEALKKMALQAPAPTGLSPAEVSSSVAYRTKKGEWYRVSGEGKVYKHDGAQWTLAKEGKKSDVPALFFREIVFPDIGYSVPVLTLPTTLAQAPR